MVEVINLAAPGRVPCPMCGDTKTFTKDTRCTYRNVTRRRRVCQACEHRFTTIEAPIDLWEKNMAPQAVIEGAFRALELAAQAIRQLGGERGLMFEDDVAEDAKRIARGE